MTIERLKELLGRPDWDEDEGLSALGDVDVVPFDVAERIFLDVDEEAECFRYGQALPLAAVARLPRGDVRVLDILLRHLSLAPFLAYQEEELEPYFHAFDEELLPLIRPFAYLDPLELAIEVTRGLTGGPPAGIDEEMDQELLIRVRRIGNLIMGGGQSPTLESPRTIRDVVRILERNL